MTARPIVVVRARHSQITHAVSQDSDSPTVTMCNRQIKGWLVAETEDVSCLKCSDWLYGGQN